jgi:hypothetical protein
VGLERGPLSILSTTEKVLDRKSCGSCLEIRKYGLRDPSRLPRGTPLCAKFDANFDDKRRSLGWYSSLSDSGNGVYILVFSGITSKQSSGLAEEFQGVSLQIHKEDKIRDKGPVFGKSGSA